MGQIGDTNRHCLDPNRYPLFFKAPSRHIIDIEGDWHNCTLPDWVQDAILTINGAHKGLRAERMFIRPTFSRLLVKLAKSAEPPPPFPAELGFGFRGKRDPLGVREKVHLAAAGLPVRWEWMSQWSAPAAPDSDVSIRYQELLQACAVCFCPRGDGHDTVRFFEVCWYGRVPIVIGDNMLMGSDGYDMSFVHQIPTSLSVEEMTEFFRRVAQTGWEELRERGKAARAYFDNVVQPYFRDPTLSFLRWLQRDRRAI
jgi:hypothetical protein